MNNKDIELLIDAKEEDTSPCCDAKSYNGRCDDCGESWK